MDTPKDYESFITKFGGRVDCGEPRFCLWWGSREHPKMALPAEYFVPYMNCFSLLEWRPASDFGLQEDWPGEDFGPYPVRGGYLPLWLFREKGEPARIDSEQLNKEFIGMLIYLHVRHEHDSMAERRRVKGELTAKKDEAMLERIADCLQNAFPYFKDAASYSGQRSCTTAVKQKMDQIERNMKYVRNFRQRIPKGPSIHNPARTSAGIYLP